MITKASPLQGESMGSVDKVTIHAVAGLHTIDLRVAPGSATLSAIEEALGIQLTLKTGSVGRTTISNGDEVQALCLAPDWWLIIGLTDAEQRLGLLRSNAEYHFSAVNVSGQRTTIELEGPHASEVLAHLWEQDLREKRFPVGCVSQGLMAKAPVIVCHMAPLRYRVMVRSSFAAHLWKGIVDAAGGWK